MDHLDLIVDGKLKRAAIMLFYRRPGRIITGSYVKVGGKEAWGGVVYKKSAKHVVPKYQIDTLDDTLGDVLENKILQEFVHKGGKRFGYWEDQSQQGKNSRKKLISPCLREFLLI